MRHHVTYSKDIKEKFVKGSFEYMVNHGLENISIRALCSEMSLPAGSLYYWFKDKDDLFLHAAEYGIRSMTEKLFDFAIDKLCNIDLLFDTILDEFMKYEKELNLIYQITASPVYGDKMREIGATFDNDFEKYAKLLAAMIRCDVEEIKPFVYLMFSEALDYVLWKNKLKTETTLNHISKEFKALVEKSSK